jgi:hypothetical protein
MQEGVQVLKFKRLKVNDAMMKTIRRIANPKRVISSVSTSRIRGSLPFAWAPDSNACLSSDQAHISPRAV